MAKYSYQQSCFVFIPMGLETFRLWGTEANELVCSIGRKLKEKTGELRSTEFWKQSLSMEIERGNATFVMGTIPATKAFDQIFFVL